MNDPNKSTETLHSAEDDRRPESMPADVPSFIGRYRVEMVLGRGGFGCVYLAHDEELMRPVAIKVPNPGRIAGPRDIEQYLTEARVVASLDHPHIVPVWDVGRTADGLCFVVSRFIEGSDLAKRLQAHRPTFGEAAALVATVAEALHYAHRQGVVHRDVKPANILLDRAGKPYVADFGLALKEVDFGKGSGLAGTPAYMSPEQARGEGHRVDGRSDVFSLGVAFYEMLTGCRPFPSRSVEGLLEEIRSLEVRPPRQVDDAIPKELERICLKAVAKRVTERFPTAKDLADDLRHYLDSAPATPPSAMPLPAALPGNTDATPPLSPVPSPSSDRPLRIVPKGLRSFDQGDADFFLDLLPGPRDRDGLPDSIRFWKNRIEALDADSTFAVGLLYGPSGCGKSSQVKAGLLPRLAPHVLAIHVEATADDTEARLLKGLRKQCRDLPADLDLAASLAALRRGRYLPSNAKVLLVLDQFEQWLHARRAAEDQHLVQALRQCDGERVQAIVMVRDDFWMAATRFMQALEIPLVDRVNSAAVDLFDPLHARKVLAAFGRAHGRLPDNLGQCSKEQNAFLDQAVAGLAQDGKVISVRLALFAEMVKGKPWTPATLKEIGGTEGVGVTFLEETFTASTAPPHHRLHQKAAQAVLKALLPDAETEIKGHMRSYPELLEASGYAARPKDFDDLLRILDGEIRLITPTDPEGYDPEPYEPEASARGKLPDPSLADASGPLNTRFFQLTHDYLVPSLRDWLTRKQKETRRGRAELLLADRAAVWNARPENRQLPSLVQWLRIRWWTRKQQWTPPQKKMMAVAKSRLALRSGVMAALLLLFFWLGWEFLGRVETGVLNYRLLEARIEDVPQIVKDMGPYRRWLDDPLRQQFAEAKWSGNTRIQLHLSLALLPGDPDQVPYLSNRLLDAATHEFPVIRDALFPYKNELRDNLWVVVEKPAKGQKSQRLRAAAALAKYDPDGERWAKASGLVIEDLLRENPVFLGQWTDAFRPVKNRLLPRLSAIFRDREPERAAERSLATNLLVDYAADQPQVLADLLMDADERQFATLYPKVQDLAGHALPFLDAEFSQEAKVPPDRVVFEIEGKVAEDDPKVKGEMPARRHEVRLLAGKQYRLTLDSKEIDSYLLVQNKAGRVLAFDDDGGGFPNSLLYFTAPVDDAYQVFAASYRGTGSFHLKVVETFAGAFEGIKERLAKRQANAAVAFLRLGQLEKVWPLLRHPGADYSSPATPYPPPFSDPRVRSYLIHRLFPLGADSAVIVRRLDEETDVSSRRALLLALGDFDEETLPPANRTSLLPKVQTLYRDHPDPGLHAAAEWLLRRWNQDDWIRQMNDEWAGGKVAGGGWRVEGKGRLVPPPSTRHTSPGWYVNGQGQTFTVIPGPVEFRMGSPHTEKGRFESEVQHMRRIGRTVAIAQKSVTLAEYRNLTKDTYKIADKYSHSTDLPVVGINWYMAAIYCNLLSKAEGIPEEQWCYEIKGTAPNYFGSRLKENYLSRTGYRLPTEAEMEYATRAGTVTSRYFGESEELLGKYAWHMKNSDDRLQRVGLKKPNDFGFFDMLGNCNMWCQEPYANYPKAEGTELVQDIEIPKGRTVIIGTDSRVLRGGSFINLPSLLRSSNRFNDVPANRSYYVGFRPARTLRP